MAVIQDFYALPLYNTVTPSSAGAAGAPTFARPPSGYIVQALFPQTDTTTEILSDVQWLTQVDWK